MNENDIQKDAHGQRAGVGEGRGDLGVRFDKLNTPQAQRTEGGSAEVLLEHSILEAPVRSSFPRKRESRIGMEDSPLFRRRLSRNKMTNLIDMGSWSTR